MKSFLCSLLLHKMELLSYTDCVKGTVIRRPSATCKTPYVADVQLEDGTIVLAHTAALGCCGLADKDAIVMMIHIDKPKNICKYKILFTEHKEREHIQYIGIDPKMAETVVNECLKKNQIPSLVGCKSIKREKTIMDSRFDFMGVDQNDKVYVLEVKNVPLADYEDCYEKEKKKMDFSTRKYTSKISYFPDGYRKKVKDTVSPRALKHIQHLTRISKLEDARAIICYVIQRTDSCVFQASNIDPIYKEAVHEAYKSGVEIIPLQIEWRLDTKTNSMHAYVYDILKFNV